MKKFLSCLLAIFCPPLGVLLGGGSPLSLALNFILTITFWIPGVIHAIFVILSQDD